MSLYLGTNLVAPNSSNSANKDLSNLTDTGKNISNWSSNVSNCITEIPQDIKLELNNGTITVKAGSKIYIPNGFESDGTTLKFDTVILENDETVGSYGTDADVLQFRFPSGAFASRNPETQVFSGSTAPTSSQYMIWYDTTNNLVKVTSNSGSTWTSGASFPISLSSTVSSSYTSIKQVFNGFGYICSTVFALPGVKGLYCNGRNSDGSLSSVPFEIENVTINNAFNNNATSYFIYTRTKTIGRSIAKDTTYNKDINDIVRPDGLYSGDCICGILQSTTDGVQWFNPKQPFHSLDFNDGSEIAKIGMPSDKYIALTVGATGTTYEAPANGYFVFYASSSASGQYLQITRGRMNTRVYSSASGQAWRVFIPIRKGRSVTTTYTMPNSKELSFVYAQGEVEDV